MTATGNSFLAAADALDERVFQQKLASADHLASIFGSADWVADGNALRTPDGELVVDAGSVELSTYLSEYDPASVRRAASSKQSAVQRMREAIQAGNHEDITAAAPAFMNLVREYAQRAELDPELIEEELNRD